MLQAVLVTTKEELQQINALNQQNLKQNITTEERDKEGFLTWLYPLPLLEQMQNLAPSVVVKNKDIIAGYALTTLKEAAPFHPDLQNMFESLSHLQYNGRPLFSYSFYCMGQICVAKEYRGMGIVKSLYQKHKEAYGQQFDLLVTEISTSNLRSQKAHEKIGFKTIYTYSDAKDEWNVVVWDWQQ